MAKFLRLIKDQIKHVWHDMQNYGVSKEVLMAEIEVMHRLHADNVSMFVCSMLSCR